MNVIALAMICIGIIGVSLGIGNLVSLGMGWLSFGVLTLLTAFVILIIPALTQTVERNPDS